MSSVFLRFREFDNITQIIVKYIMIQAITLLLAAVQLLTLVNATSNLTPEFRESATNLANYAVEVANKALETENTTTTYKEYVIPSLPPVVTEPTPILGTQTMPEVQKDILIEVDEFSNVSGRYYDVYAYYTEDGTAKQASITLTPNDEGRVTVNSQIGNTGQTRGVGRSGKLGVYFQYVPAEAGERTLTITANGASKEITLKGK